MDEKISKPQGFRLLYFGIALLGAQAVSETWVCKGAVKGSAVVPTRAGPACGC